jgi:predicted nuclease of predicted toxin-antitoxin system
VKLLANENFPLASIRQLRQAGYEVESVTETMLSAPDTQVLKHAAANKQIILTFDKDYGELIFHRKIAVPDGLIFLKFDPFTPLEPGEMLIEMIFKAGIEITGFFIVLERDAIRKRKLPAFLK